MNFFLSLTSTNSRPWRTFLAALIPKENAPSNFPDLSQLQHRWLLRSEITRHSKGIPEFFLSFQNYFSTLWEIRDMFLTLHEQPLAQRVEIFSLNYFPLRRNVFYNYPKLLFLLVVNVQSWLKLRRREGGVFLQFCQTCQCYSSRFLLEWQAGGD